MIEIERLPKPSELIEQSCPKLERAVSQIEGVVRRGEGAGKRSVKFKREYTLLIKTIKALWKIEKYLDREGY